MPKISYQNFDLVIETVDIAASRFRASVLHSPSGEASCEFTLPFTDVESENYILKLGRARSGVRNLNSPEGKVAMDFGSKLYNAVFQGAVRTSLQESLKSQPWIRICIHLEKAHTLVDLPWEYLYDPEKRRFFAHSNKTPIIRFYDLAEAIIPLPVQLPFKVLAMIANPRDLPELNVEAEWSQIQKALAIPIQRGLVALKRVEVASLDALRHQLRQDQYHVFHFVGHGGFDQQTQSGVLIFERENGESQLVAGLHLGAMLHDHPSLRLVLLNACEGARAGRNDPFAGVAQHLISQGMPAVIAMQFAITDKAAITLAQELYKALADQYPIDAALAEARKAIFVENDIEWGTPVLYMSTPHGTMFNTQMMAGPRFNPHSGKTTSWTRTKSIQLRIEPTEIAVIPGNEVQIRVLLANHGKEQEFYKIRLLGIPADWVTVSPGELLELKPPDVRTATITIRPPASVKTRAGHFRIYIEAESTRAQTKSLRVKAKLKIRSFGEIKSELHPMQTQVGESFELLIKNRRNQTEQVTLTCEDESQLLEFEIPNPQVEIPAGENRVLKFSAQLRQPRWFGGRKEYPFLAKVEIRGRQAEIHHGTVISWGRIHIPS